MVHRKQIYRVFCGLCPFCTSDLEYLASIVDNTHPDGRGFYRITWWLDNYKATDDGGGDITQAIKFPPEMREALPEDLQSTLFDWTAPTPEEAVGQVKVTSYRHGLHCRMP